MTVSPDVLAEASPKLLHRMGLHDAALFKDNHLAGIPSGELAGRLAAACREARARGVPPGPPRAPHSAAEAVRALELASPRRRRSSPSPSARPIPWRHSTPPAAPSRTRATPRCSPATSPRPARRGARGAPVCQIWRERALGAVVQPTLGQIWAARRARAVRASTCAAQVARRACAARVARRACAVRVRGRARYAPFCRYATTASTRR